MSDIDPYRDMLRDDAVQWDDCDNAIIGVVKRCDNAGVLLYDYDLLVAVFIEQGMSEEEAVEWIDHNILGAWVGEGTPFIFFGDQR